MAQVYIPRWVQIVLRMTTQGVIYENTFNYRITNAVVPTGAQLQALAQAWWGTAPNPFTAAASTSVNFLDVTARDFSNAAGEQGTYTIPAGTTGGQGGEIMPLNVAGSVSLRSAGIGRRKRGRFYWSGMTESFVNGNSFTLPMLTLLTQIGQFYLLFTGTAAVPVEASVASRVAVALSKVTAIVIDAFVDSQRRRLTGRGR